MKVVTVATEEKFHFKNLKQSVEAQGQTLHVLGQGKAYHAHYMKDVWMLDFCRGLPRDEVVLFVDGYDSVVCGDLGDLEQKFLGTTFPMVISMDGVNCNENILCKYTYNKIMSFKGNTGIYIGYAGHIRDFIEAVRSDPRRAKNPSNQSAWGKFYNTQPKDKWLAVDENHDFFYNLVHFQNNPIGSDFKVTRDKAFTELYFRGKQVFVVSAPGSTDLNTLVAKLGYDPVVGENKTMANNAKYYFRFFIPEIVALIALVLVIGAWVRKKGSATK